MTISTPVYPATIPDQLAPPARLLRWTLPVVGGLLLSLGFPNELPGVLGRLLLTLGFSPHLNFALRAIGDHPPCWLAWLALLPLMWMLYRWPERMARRGAALYAAACYLGVLSWMHLFGYLPWALLAGLLALTVWVAVRLAASMALPRWLQPLGLACAWTGIEWARSQSIFSFSWGEIGASQVDGFPARLAALGSVYLISFLMLLLTGMCVQGLLDRTTPRWFIAAVVGFALLCLGAGWWQTIRTESRWQHAAQSQVFALVQPCSQRGLTPQALVTPMTNDEFTTRVTTLLDLSRQSLHGVARAPGSAPPIVVWSETALPCPPVELPDVGNFILQTHCSLLAGAPYFAPASGNPYNSAYLFAPDGRNIDRYDKIHLVPFGEFVPLRKLVQRFYTVREDDILPGPGWRPLRIGAQPAGVGICFESSISAVARSYADQGAHYLIYITNDAWFWQTPAVRQHFNHARFRALETGLPVVRVAGTGISGFIAPDGHTISEIPVYRQGTDTRRLQAGTPGTLYTRAGWVFGPFCLLLSLLLGARGLWRSRERKVISDQ